MRIYIGHRLPFGFHATVGFGGYGAPSVRHGDKDVRMNDVTILAVLLLMIALFWWMAGTAFGQQISPITQEAKGPRARGEIIVTNNGLVPLAVVLEPATLTGANGKPSVTPLHGVTLKLSEQSARLGPKQSRVISYDARCDQLPCAFTVFAKFVQGHTDQGVAIAIHLPSTVYVCEKKNGCRERVLRSMGLSSFLTAGAK